MGRIFLGTSGWEYPEWEGRVYPRTITDKLSYYTRLFPIVEIDSTFYGLQPPRVAANWARKTPSRFRFAAKFPQTITHDLRLVDTDEELRRFLDLMKPLQDAGKFIAGLLQLPPSLPFDPQVVRAFYEKIPSGFPVAVEFRERSWLVPDSFDLLREFEFAHVVVDGPTVPVRLDVTAPFAYVRWHGHGSPVMYDYSYPKEEIVSWVPRIRELEERAEAVYGFFNNHYRGDSVTNAQTLAEELGLPAPPWTSRLMP